MARHRVMIPRLAPLLVQVAAGEERLILQPLVLLAVLVVEEPEINRQARETRRVQLPRKVIAVGLAAFQVLLVLAEVAALVLLAVTEVAQLAVVEEREPHHQFLAVP